MGVHDYEDKSQELDPSYHILGEVEREHAERLAVEEFRKGAEVKFVIHEKKRPSHYHYRF